MTIKAPLVDWYAYAQKYDLLLSYNPYYQEVYQKIRSIVQSWQLPEGAYVADLGGGTGNYSVEIARLLPQQHILHVENNAGMNAVAMRKAKGLQNWKLIDKDIGDLVLEAKQLDAILCINALYTFPEPHLQLKRMYDWLAPDGKVVFVDPGRIMNVFSWRMAITWHLLRQHGLATTLSVFKEAKAIGEQNSYIRKMQLNGTYWTHSHAEFCEAIEVAGFSIKQARKCFRGDCDFVIAIKEN